MRRPGVAAIATIIIAFAHPALAANGGHHMPAPIVFFDIAGPDMAKQASFYRAVLDQDVSKDGRFSAPAATPLPATLRADPAGVIVYFGVDDVAATLAKVVAHGGKIVQPRFEVKGVVVLGLFTDPAGNAMGLVEMDGGKPKVP